MKYQRPRGTRDILPEEVKIKKKIENVIEHVFLLYNFEEIITPLFESKDLFTCSVGDTTDIVEKEMYTFFDRKGYEFALRPEGTASVVRAVVENNLLSQKRILKLFYRGSMYRYERQQRGRYREFYQMGLELFGAESAYADVEILLIVSHIMDNLNIEDAKLYINSLGCPSCRENYRYVLSKYIEDRKALLCADCQRRLQRNVLRVLDCKIDGENLADAPAAIDYLCEDCNSHYKQLISLLEELNVKYEVDKKLVRGIDYYTRTVFEVKHPAFTSGQDTICAGGRYDYLVEKLGGERTPAIGFAWGIDRLMEVVDVDKIPTPKDLLTEKKIVFFSYLGEEARRRGLKIVTDLRKSNIKVESMLYEGSSLKSQLRYANKINAAYAIILGDSELQRSIVLVRDMKNNTQEECSIDKICEYIKDKMED
jgi:histidyl-tRNA synthetase